jgi:hypothetical protein
VLSQLTHYRHSPWRRRGRRRSGLHLSPSRLRPSAASPAVSSVSSFAAMMVVRQPATERGGVSVRANTHTRLTAWRGRQPGLDGLRGFPLLCTDATVIASRRTALRGQVAALRQLPLERRPALPYCVLPLPAGAAALPGGQPHVSFGELVRRGGARCLVVAAGTGRVRLVGRRRVARSSSPAYWLVNGFARPS